MPLIVNLIISPHPDRTPSSPSSAAPRHTDTHLVRFVKRGGLGKLVHRRKLPLEHTGVRPNRDTLHPEAVFDLGSGPAITLPDAGSVQHGDAGNR
jgi:hypothetical protein